MKAVIITALALPALALAAAVNTVEPRQENQIVRIIDAKPKEGGGDGCLPGEMSYMPVNFGGGGMVTFDNYATYVNAGEGQPGNPGVLRERSCRFDLTLRFPLGCYTGALEMIYHGDIRLPGPRFDGTYLADYTLERAAETGPDPAPLRYTYATYPGEQAHQQHHTVQITAEVCNENERDYTFTTDSRIFLNSPGDTTEYAYFSIFDSHVQVRNVTAVQCKRPNCVRNK